MVNPREPRVPSIASTDRRTVVTHVIIVDKILGLIPPAKGRLILTAKDFISGRYDKECRVLRRAVIVNLCQHYSYLKTGYYCSLLADARDHFCIPAISDIIHAHWKRIHSGRFHELEAALNDPERSRTEETPLSIEIFFGRTERPEFEEFGRTVFDVFRLPAVTVKIEHREGRRYIKSITPRVVQETGAHLDAFNSALNEFTGTRWTKTRNTGREEKYWLAILHDPQETFAPSDPKALQNFIRVGKTMGFYVELITKSDLNALLEFDALFIRETTAVNTHTYRFAEKAAREGLAVIDDPVSILRCCNKVYLQEMLVKHGLPTPPTRLLYRLQDELPKLEADAFPKVLKIPDGSFSRGVIKVKDQAEFDTQIRDMFTKSEIILMQDFMRSEFDWRIVVVNDTVLFACKYYMAKAHWQIYNHGNKTDDSGNAECIALPDVPELVLKTALAACAIIGNGLYGVDLKEIDGQVYVIEVNDNPNIDAGTEDELLGDTLYRTILMHFKALIDAK